MQRTLEARTALCLTQMCCCTAGDKQALAALKQLVPQLARALADDGMTAPYLVVSMGGWLLLLGCKPAVASRVAEHNMFHVALQGNYEGKGDNKTGFPADVWEVVTDAVVKFAKDNKLTATAKLELQRAIAKATGKLCKSGDEASSAGKSECKFDMGVQLG